MRFRVPASICGVAAMMAAAACTLDLEGYAGDPVDAAPALSDGGGDESDGPAPADASSELEASASDAYRALVMSDGPVGYWRLADDSSKAHDEVGQHDGVYEGTTTPATGVFGNPAPSFSNGGYVDLGDAFPFFGTAPFSLEAWTTPTGPGNSTACVLARDEPGDSGSPEEGWAFYLESTDKLTGGRFHGANEQGANGPLVSSSALSHVAMTYDGSNVVLYINGVAVGSGSSSGAIASFAMSATIAASRGGTACFYRGVLSEVAVYDKPLDPTRVRAHYLAGAQ